MDHLTIESLAGRIEKLECDNRRLCKSRGRWRVGGSIVVAGAGLLAMAGAAAQSFPSIESKEFVLRDDNGKARAALTIRPDGTPGLGLMDPEGHIRCSFDLGVDDAPSMNLFDGDGSLRAALAIRPDGSPGIGLFDKGNRPRLSLDLGNDGSAGVNVHGENGSLRAALAIRADGTPALGLFDEAGKVGRSIELGSDRGQSRAAAE